MEQIAKVDEKGRVQIPRKVRESIRLSPRERVVVQVRDDGIFISKASKKKPETDKLLSDLNHPGHSKVRVTRKLLENLEKELWMS